MVPRVSVVMPVFNAGATVARAIASIRAQTRADWELIAVDDGSTDETSAVLTRIAAQEPRLRVLARPHEGIVAALNAGLAAARGELIARMDADDESAPARLAAQVAFMDAPGNRAVGLVSCLVEFGGDPSASAGYALHVDWINGLLTADEIAVNRFVESPFAHPSVLFRRDLLERQGGYRAGDFPEDYELWLRWLEAGVRMAKVPAVLLRWNDPPARLSRIDARYRPEAFFRMKAEWVAHELARRGVASAPEAHDAKRERDRGSASGVGRRVWIWGAGRPTRKRAASLQAHGIAVAGYIDVDPKKITRALGGVGVPVLAPAELPPPRDAFVLGYVSSRGARAWIRDALRARGYTEGADFLMCA